MTKHWVTMVLKYLVFFYGSNALVINATLCIFRSYTCGISTGISTGLCGTVVVCRVLNSQAGFVSSAWFPLCDRGWRNVQDDGGSD